MLSGYSYLTIVGSAAMLLVSGWVIFHVFHLDEKVEQAVQK